MLITKTPLRISFAGGGTDLREFYQHEPGAVVSTTINLYVYLAVHRYFEQLIVLKYSETEMVKRVKEIRHPLLRECLALCDVRGSIEVTSFADIPSRGSGLGGSSSFAVGLIKALHAFLGRTVSADKCASMACEVEINRLGEPIGKQDQYAAAFGGLNYIRFNPDESVHVEPILIDREGRRFLEEHLIMFHTGITRKASDALSEQKSNTKLDSEHFKTLRAMKADADDLRNVLTFGNFEELGAVMHRGWTMKRTLATRVSNSLIDDAYDAAMRAGAMGGKLLGAGGGGFLLFFCPPCRRNAVTEALRGLRVISPKIDTQGSRLIYVGD